MGSREQHIEHDKFFDPNLLSRQWFVVLLLLYATWHPLFQPLLNDQIDTINPCLVSKQWSRAHEVVVSFVLLYYLYHCCPILSMIFFVLTWRVASTMRPVGYRVQERQHTQLVVTGALRRVSTRNAPTTRRRIYVVLSCFEEQLCLQWCLHCCWHCWHSRPNANKKYQSTWGLW